MNFVLPFILYLKATNFSLFEWKWLQCLCGYQDNQQTHLYYDLLSDISAPTTNTIFDEDEEDGEDVDLEVNPAEDSMLLEDPLSWPPINIDPTDINAPLPPIDDSLFLPADRKQDCEHPLPHPLRSIGVSFICLLLGIIFIIICLQIGLDVFFLIIKGQSPI